MKKEKRALQLRLPEDIYNFVKNEATQKEITMNAYILSLIAQNVQSMKEIDIDEDGKKPKEYIMIRLSEEEKKLLYDRAEDAGLSPSMFIKDILQKKAMANLTIEVTDMHEAMKKIDVLVTAVNGIATALLRSGTVYKNDVVKILDIMTKINESFNSYCREIYAMRHDLYAEAKTKLYDDLSDLKVTRRRRKK